MKGLRNSISSTLTPRSVALILLLLLPLGSCLAQQAASSPVATVGTKGMLPPAGRSTEGVDDRYRIGPGDLISITTLDYPQLSADAVRVDSKGMILLPMVDGQMEAACRTEGELAQEISKRYLKYLKEPQVKVFVKEYQSQTVAVIGAVNLPGRFQLNRRLHLLELLTFVNGPADRAGQTIQIIHAGNAPVCSASASAASDAPDSAAEAIVTLKLKETMRGSEKANPFVQAGDIITVLDADQYYILGNVLRPSAYPLKESLTLAQALVVAGGTLPDTDTRHVKIVRHSAEGQRTELFVDVKTTAKQQTAEFLLQPNDIVEVNKQGGAGMALKGMLRLMVPMVTQLPLRVIP